MPQKKLPRTILIDEDIDSTDEDYEDPDEVQGPTKKDIVSEFIRMWPRAIFDTPETEGQKGSIASKVKELRKPGVYILYRDDVPFYVGKTEGELFSRLWQHANGVLSPRSYFWNYFSAFIVKDSRYIAEVEAILISAMPSVITNSSKPKLQRVATGKSIRKLKRKLRESGRY